MVGGEWVATRGVDVVHYMHFSSGFLGRAFSQPSSMSSEASSRHSETSGDLPTDCFRASQKVSEHGLLGRPAQHHAGLLLI